MKKLIFGLFCEENAKRFTNVHRIGAVQNDM